ncbi:MAG: 30S ribosomal protein S4 [Patescibacteria group bacterium]|nr:30S ribosomal protein S4 [Patescibacteria group bacterium]
MARDTKQCAKCRRAGEKLFLKGEKCFGPKCPLLKRNYPPGMHGSEAKHHSKLSGYGKQLREKQKAKRIYGIMERQFANYVAEASKKVGNTGIILINYLESRLDNAVYRMGLGKSRQSARQIVSHGHITVNGRKVDVPSFRVKVGQIIALKESSKNKPAFTNIEERLAKAEAPSWISVDAKKVSAKITSDPVKEEPEFDAKTIIEFYSR